MTRDLSLSNGKLPVNFDRQYRLRDLYWPHVGDENHTGGHPFRFGVYCDDQYKRVDSSGRVPGNPWFVCTCWPAQWYIRKATQPADLEPAARLVEWAASRALPNGLMAEQIHPFTDEPLSACPLTWSHSTFVVTVHEYMTRCRARHCDSRVLESVAS